MNTAFMDAPIDMHELDLGPRAVRALRDAGVVTVRDLVALDLARLKRDVRGVGRVTVGEIRDTQDRFSPILEEEIAWVEFRRAVFDLNTRLAAHPGFSITLIGGHLAPMWRHHTTRSRLQQISELLARASDDLTKLSVSAGIEQELMGPDG